MVHYHRPKRLYLDLILSITPHCSSLGTRPSLAAPSSIHFTYHLSRSMLLEALPNHPPEDFLEVCFAGAEAFLAVSYTHLRAHET